MKQYFFNLLISFDQLGNTLLNGHPDETISSRVGKAQMKGKLRGRILAPIIDFFFGKDHCKNSIEYDEG